MGLNFIFGKSGTGKSEYLINKMLNSSAENVIYLVPEQFTLSSQKKLVEKTEEKGIMKLEVLSFLRLAYKVFLTTGGDKHKVLDDIGENIVISKILKDIGEDLKYYKKASKKLGFSKKVLETLTEIYTYDFDFSKIDKSKKEEDIEKIYIKFKEFIDQKYTKTEDIFNILADKVKESNFIKNSEIYIDEFYGFTPVERKVIIELLKNSKEVYIAMPLGKYEYENSLKDTNGFFEIKKNVDKLKEKCNLEDIKIEKIVYLSGIKNKVDEIKHIAENYLKYDYKQYKENVENIEIKECSTRYDEIRSVIEIILNKVRNDNYIFNDFAILIGDLNEYKIFLENELILNDIPYFIDEKRDIKNEKLIKFIIHSLEVIESNFNTDKVFSFLKLGYIEDINIDMLENYCLAHNVRGYKRWNKEFENIDRRNDLEYEKLKLDKVNHTRETFIDNFKDLKDDLKSAKKVKDYIKGSYDFIMKFDSKIENIEVYNKIVEIYDKFYEIIGEEDLKLKDFINILKRIFDQSKLGMVPKTDNSLLIGDIERTRLDDKKAVLILGVNDGIIPRRPEEIGLFSDVDRNKYFEEEIEVSKSKYRKSFEEKFLIYNVITKPSEYLYLSYSLADFEGSSLRSSIIISKFLKLFKNLHIKSDILNNEPLITTPAGSFSEMIKRVRNYLDTDKKTPYLFDLYSWYLKSDKWSDITKNILHKDIKIDESIQRDINILNTSFSRLRKYNQCPFSYFVEYDLKAKERKEYKFERKDIGLMFHRVLELFFTKVNNRNIDYNDIDDKFIQEKINEILDEIGFEILNSNNKYKIMTIRLEKMMKKALNILVDHVKKGKFEQLGFEIEFGNKLDKIEIKIDDKHKVSLSGKIDRVDILEKEEKAYVKIIDYKSSNKNFALSDLYNRENLQLLIYLDAVIKNGKKIVGKELIPAGFYYFGIDNPIITEKDRKYSEEQIKSKILKEFKMNGVTINDVEIIKEIDNEFEKVSDIVNVKLKNDGDFYSYSDVLSDKDIIKLSKYAKNKAAEIAKDIIDGKIDVNPLKENSNHKACDYCNFRPICKFDERFNKYKLKDNVKDEIVLEEARKIDEKENS